MSVCNYYPLLERKGNLLWRTWAVVLIRIQFCFLKTNKETNDKREGWVKKRNGGRRGRINSLGSGFLPAWLLQEKKKRKRKDIACGFIICFKIWQKCVNVKAFKVLLSNSFLVTGSQQYCQKSVLAGKVRLFSNRKKDLDKKETTECRREKRKLEWV